MLRLHPNVVDEWRRSGKVNYSEPVYLGKAKAGALYWLSNREDFVKAVKAAEDEFDIVIYHVIYTRTAVGELLSCLYVAEVEEDWVIDQEDLQRKSDNDLLWPFSYVINLTYPECSEFGRIGIKEAAGGLVREY